MSDLDRLRQEYGRRAIINDDRYSWFYPPYNYAMQKRERMILSRLKKYLHLSFNESRLLEIGCGSGGVLLDFMKWGIKPSGLFGIDLLHDRLVDAKLKLPANNLANANGECLPFDSNNFDLVMQFTALSSILDVDIRKNVAKEMIRVLKPGGLIIWYDFWLNPTNPETHGLTKREIKELFSDSCEYHFLKTTLAPPIARRVVPFSRVLAEILEAVGVFNSHWLVFIQKKL